MSAGKEIAPQFGDPFSAARRRYASDTIGPAQMAELRSVPGSCYRRMDGLRRSLCDPSVVDQSSVQFCHAIPISPADVDWTGQIADIPITRTELSSSIIPHQWRVDGQLLAEVLFGWLLYLLFLVIATARYHKWTPADRDDHAGLTVTLVTEPD